MNRKYFELLLISGLILAFAAGCSKPKRKTYEDIGEDDTVDIFYTEVIEGKLKLDKDSRRKSAKKRKVAKAAPAKPFGAPSKAAPKKKTPSRSAKAAPKSASPVAAPMMPVAPAKTKKPAAFKKSAASPEDAQIKKVLKFAHKAVDKNDRKNYLANVHYNAKNKKIVIALFDALVAMNKFEAAMKKTYGPNAMDSKNAGMILGMISEIPTVEDIDTKSMIQRNGNKALVVIQGMNTKPSEMIKVAGKWKMDIVASMPDSVTDKQALGMMKSFKVTAMNCTKMVGKKGQTPDKILKMFEQRMMMSMAMSMGGPGGMKPPAGIKAPKGTKMPAGIDAATMNKLKKVAMRANPQEQAKIMKLYQKFKTRGKLSKSDMKAVAKLKKKYGV